MNIFPIDTVVQVGLSSDLLMITTRFPITAQDGVKGYYDYAACLYPTGVDPNTAPFLFNHEDIREVFFIGYINPLEEKLKEHYSENFDKIPIPKFNL